MALLDFLFVAVVVVGAPLRDGDFADGLVVVVSLPIFHFDNLSENLEAH